MIYKPEIKKDLITITIIIVIFAAGLVSLKMYDAKTDQIAKIGHYILSTYVR